MLTDNKKKEEWKQELRLLLAGFAFYIGNDTGRENDNHEAEIKKFEDFILALCESIRAEALKEVEGIIGKDDIKVENKDDDEETWCDTCGNYYGGEYSTECECDTRNALRKEQRAVLAKLSKGGNNAKT